MKPETQDKPSTAVYDKGRRGNPLPGCDCVQCFGYCLVAGDEKPSPRAQEGKAYGDLSYNWLRDSE